MCKSRVVLVIAALMFGVVASGTEKNENLMIPDVNEGARRLITIEDVTRLRDIDTVSVSPDGRDFAIFVKQDNAVANEYNAAWFVGSVLGGALTYVGDGGQIRPDEAGHLVGRESRWSPDGRWIAYTLRRDDEVQLWRSRSDGSSQEQVTHNAADVREFAWSEDGRALYFTVGKTRSELRAHEQAMDRQGYQYDEDIGRFTDFMSTPMWRPREAGHSTWVVTLGNRQEHLAYEAELAAFERAQARQAAGIEVATGFIDDVKVRPVVRSDGALVWLARAKETSRRLYVTALLKGDSDAITCVAEECLGHIQRVWWSEDGERVLFWRREGINHRTHGFYAWSPSSSVVSTILRAQDDDFRLCMPAANDRLICARETPTRPAHMAVIDLRSGAVKIAGDVNPEFRNIRLGKVERFEWNTPRFGWNEPGGQLAGRYEERAYGYILYPPDFDPTKKYPVFIDPYIAQGFNRPGSEHPIHVYAANGFIVLNMAFPLPTDEGMERSGASGMKHAYSAELGFPHMTMLMESTVRGLDVVALRGFIDEHRVGIGGVSHGTFVPLYMMQKHDRIAAISISSPHWGPFQYYWPTLGGRKDIVAALGKIGYEDFAPKPEGKGREFWSRLDIADHIDTIEAPILMHLAAQETFALIRLIRHMQDGSKPYDAYVFRNETHVKWQPAHLYAIMGRNLDWFRFWLQDYQYPDPAKAEQYVRWRRLKEQQQTNRPHELPIRE